MNIKSKIKVCAHTYNFIPEFMPVKLYRYISKFYSFTNTFKNVLKLKVCPHTPFVG